MHPPLSPVGAGVGLRVLAPVLGIEGGHVLGDEGLQALQILLSARTGCEVHHGNPERRNGPAADHPRRRIGMNEVIFANVRL
ncbi:hypothetical protein [Lysobacter gummosus]|uniref:hypothetical protein n=1 Tax=Lysobacter gummosus TaxID=262324 RepID=UPI003629616C